MDEQASHITKISRKSLVRRGIKWNNTAFLAAGTLNGTALKIDIVYVQVDKFGDADAGGVHDFEHSLISAPFGVRGGRLRKKKFNFLSGKDLGEFFLSALDVDRCNTRCLVDVSGRDQIGEEILQACKRTGNGSCRPATIAEIGEIILDIKLRGVYQVEILVGMKPFRKLPNIANVRGNCIIGRLFYRYKVIFVGGNNIQHIS